nr:YetF domain-containing protein [Mycolicibacterium frederiksbergense]
MLLVGSAAYLTLIVVLRISGKRTLAKLNAFDLVVTVAVGSTLATILLNSDVSFAEGATAFALLAALQFVAATITSRLKAGRAVVTAQPTLLLSQGRFLDHALRGQRVSIDQIRQAIRSSGQGDVSQVAAVVLESDGSLSVIPGDKIGDWSALAGVAETPEEAG